MKEAEVLVAIVVTQRWVAHWYLMRSLDPRRKDFVLLATSLATTIGLTGAVQLVSGGWFALLAFSMIVLQNRRVAKAHIYCQRCGTTTYAGKSGRVYLCRRCGLVVLR